MEDHIEIASQLLLLLLGAYILIMADGNRRWKVPVLFIGLISWFLFRNKKSHLIIWIFFFALLLTDLYNDYFWVANHHFVLVFIALSILIYNYHQRVEVLQKNIQLLLVIVLLASVVQKLMSSQFMSGNFYYYMSNQGSLFRNFLNFFPENLEIAKSNSKNLFDLHATDPNTSEGIVLTNIFPKVGFFSLIFAWITVAVESMVAIAILLKPRATWTHLLFATMIIGILCTRFETGFMASLAICGVFLCRNLYLRLLYVMITIGCTVLVITKLGYH